MLPNAKKDLHSPDLATFPDFFFIINDNGLRIRKDLPAVEIDNLLLINKVVCPKMDCTIQDLADTRKWFRVMAFDGVQLQKTECAICAYAPKCSSREELS